jgi:hypothetical protein
MTESYATAVGRTGLLFLMRTALLNAGVHKVVM